MLFETQIMHLDKLASVAWGQKMWVTLIRVSKCIIIIVMYILSLHKLLITVLSNLVR